MRHLLAIVLLLWPLAATAQSAPPASPADCERIKNDLAYNQCLASFGPKRGERAAREAADEADEPAAQAPRSRGPVRRGGRQTAVFDVVSGRDEAARPAQGSRERR